MSRHTQLIEIINELESAHQYKIADDLDRVLIKLAKKKLSCVELKNFLESKKMNMKCTELENILSDYGFDISYDSRRHIRITHPVTNWFIVTSCHQHNKPNQFNPSELHRLKAMIDEVAMIAPENFRQNEESSLQSIIDEAKARAIAEGNWRFFEEKKRRN